MSGKKSHLHYLFILIDFVAIFVILFVSFLANRGFSSVINDALVPTLIYCFSNAFVTISLLYVFRIYKMLTSNFSLLESLKIALISLIVQIVGLIAIIFIPGLPGLDRFVWAWILSTLSIMFVLPSLRMLVRVYYSLNSMFFKKGKTIPTIVIGAGDAAKVIIDDSRKNRSNKCKVVALIDDDINKIGSTLSSIPIVGPICNVKEFISKYKAEEVIIAIATLSNERYHEILSYLSDADVRVKRMPLLSEMDGPNDTRIINVDLNELLCRPAVKLDNSSVKEMLSGKCVMVTGAGGSIGSELVRQIFRTHPKTLLLFDIYENSTYEIQQELVNYMRNSNVKDIELVTLIGSTYNEVRIEQIIKKYKPDYIYHAAAYKHVPLMEDSPQEAIRTNVIGTYNVARLADKYGVKKMVLVSTDKAVRPTNVMGATKRFAETIIQYFAEKSQNTKYAAVRFGNVLGSNGSVVPLFKKQIEMGGPVTLTHKDIIRYFMTIPEAVSLILQCGLFADKGEIFILDMGNPVHIRTLAEKLIRQTGLVPYKDIDIVEIGLRPGEKLYEELLINKETQTKTSNEKIYIESAEPIKPIEKEITDISKVFKLDENIEIKSLLASIIDTYSVNGESK